MEFFEKNFGTISLLAGVITLATRKGVAGTCS